MRAATEDGAQPVSRARRLVFWLLLAAVFMALSEAAARVGYFVVDGFNPYYLIFGLVPDTDFHSLEADGYSKFHPDSVKRQKVSGGVISMRINSQGFRRTGDSDPEGAEAGFRIAALGASSTFGYYVEDHETYAAELERLLRAARPDLDVQVYNFGIPHLRIENIVELARHELPSIRPQVVTLYCGYNNVGLPNVQKAGKVSGLKNWLYFHSVLYRLVRPALKNAYLSVVRTTNKDVAKLDHLSLPLEFSQDRVDELRRRFVADFAGHLESLHGALAEIGSELVLVTQNYNLHMRGGSGLTDRVRSYREEVRFVEELLEEKGTITAVQSSLLIHRDLMSHFREFAREHGLLLVDGIEVMARDPTQMESGVHLSAQGNQWIGEAIYRQILPLLSSGWRTTGRGAPGWQPLLPQAALDLD